jgi:hypothetical protein
MKDDDYVMNPVQIVLYIGWALIGALIVAPLAALWGWLTAPKLVTVLCRHCYHPTHVRQEGRLKMVGIECPSCRKTYSVMAS